MDWAPATAPDQEEGEPDCRQNDQRWSQQTEIERGIPVRYRDQRKLERSCRILMRLRVCSSFGLADEIAEVTRHTLWDKPCAGPQNVKISGRLDIETPAIYGVKSHYDFLLKPCARRWSQPQPFAACIFGEL